MMQTDKSQKLNHFFEESAFRMINVGQKKITKRKALARGKIFLKNEVLLKVKHKTLEKGDVLVLSEIAGINGAKATSTLLPLCHPLALEHVVIKNEINLDESCVEVFCYVSAEAKTGVEMEALAGVQGSLLCIYDLCKMYGHEMHLSDVKLLYKEGGKNQCIVDASSLPKTLSVLSESEPLTLCRRKVAVITSSDRASKGEYEDKSGPLLASLLKKAGANCLAQEVIPDEKELLYAKIEALVREKKPNIIMTTGGTGMGPRDVMPEVIKSLVDYEIPGIGELLRQDGLQFTPYAPLSRSIAGCYQKTLIIALPGSTKAITQGMAVLLPLLGHLLDMIQGEGHA